MRADPVSLAERTAAPSLRDSLALAARKAMRIEHRRIAGRPALVIDGLYADPLAVRRLALDLDFYRPAGLYPGRFGFLSLRPQPLLALLNDLLGDALGRRLEFSPYYQDLSFAKVTTAPEGLAALQRQPHFDTFCDFAGVVYLGPLAPTEGGTSFWRHRRTGLDRAPGERPPSGAPAGPPGEIERMMLEGVTDLPDGYPVQSSLHWDLVEVVPMRFNRLVAYDARAFHSPHIPRFEPADDPDRVRLTQSLFLDFAPS